MSDAAAPAKPSKLKIIAELVKFEHSIFALPYAYIGALYGAASLERMDPLYELPAQVQAHLGVGSEWIYKGGGYAWPAWAALAWITLAMVGARAVAFTLNRAIDKEIDARNPRTMNRAVPSGLIKAWELWVFSILMLAMYLLAVYNLAPITHWLWPVPLALFLVYPYLKRFTWLAHYWLGACLGLGVVGGWAGVADSVASPVPWVLGAAVMLWTTGFDVIYATQDYDSDVEGGVHSIPADFGIPHALTHARVLHVLTVALFVLGGWLAGAGVAYYVGVVAATVLLWWENSIVSPTDLSRLDMAFFNVNGSIAVIMLAGVLVDRLVG